VTVFGEKVKECRPDLVDAAHIGPIGSRPGLPKTCSCPANRF
jgi:hypothetical protein